MITGSEESKGIFQPLQRAQDGNLCVESALEGFAVTNLHTFRMECLHLGTAKMMAAIMENWWIPKLRSLVKKTVRKCNICKVFSARPLPCPAFRSEMSRPFQHAGVDFAGPLVYRQRKTEEGKEYVLIFTCAVVRAVHLEVTKPQTAKEFQRKLNAFITRRTRPQLLISDNASVFKTNATWIRKIRKDEQLLNFLATQEIRCQFNPAKLPWWEGMYERIIKDIKKILYKTVDKTHLTFEQLETVIMDIERHLNNRPLTYLESDSGEDHVLMPNLVMWRQGGCILENIEVEDGELTWFNRRLHTAREHAWSRWQEYIHSLMDAHRIKGTDNQPPQNWWPC